MNKSKGGIIYIKYLFIILLSFTIGCIFSYKYYFENKFLPPIDIRENSKEYSFINPLIFSRVGKEFYSNEFYKLNIILNNGINKILYNKNVSSVSVYYRDLNTGHWTGINEDVKYHPSSMLKVLGLMSYYRRSEVEKDLFNKNLFYKDEIDFGQHYKPKRSLPEGYYNMGTLLEQMIIYSDNNVLNILDKEDKGNFFNKVYNDLRLPLASSTDDIDGFMSPRSYSALFRVLYNSTYLSRSNSEKVLKILSNTDFDNGIRAGIPKDIVVSHKFGEHTNEFNDGSLIKHELHDCGIVYYTKSPYLICIMTSGSNFNDLESAISNISKLIYNYIDNKYHRYD